MAELSVLDLQNLRHLIGGYTTCHCKLQDYASQAQDPEVKKLFQDAANSAMKNKRRPHRRQWRTDPFWRDDPADREQRIEAVLKADEKRV